MFDRVQGGHALNMKHTDIVRTPVQLVRDATDALSSDTTTGSSSDGSDGAGVTEVLGGVASAVAGTGGFGVRTAARQARRHPQAVGIVVLIALAAYGGWRWCGRRSKSDEPSVSLLDAA